jgi:hypothetical protein
MRGLMCASALIEVFEYNTKNHGRSGANNLD